MDACVMLLPLKECFAKNAWQAIFALISLFSASAEVFSARAIKYRAGCVPFWPALLGLAPVLDFCAPSSYALAVLSGRVLTKDPDATCARQRSFAENIRI